MKRENQAQGLSASYDISSTAVIFAQDIPGEREKKREILGKRKRDVMTKKETERENQQKNPSP